MKNINTDKGTSLWLSVWKTWYEGESIHVALAEMNRLLKKFYAEVKEKYDLPTLPLFKFFHVYKYCL